MPTSYLMISAYSLSFPLLSLHLRYMTEASTLAGENVFGSFSREMTLNRIVLKHRHTLIMQLPKYCSVSQMLFWCVSCENFTRFNASMCMARATPVLLNVQCIQCLYTRMQLPFYLFFHYCISFKVYPLVCVWFLFSFTAALM